MIPLSLYVGLKTGFMFSEFTRAYASCVLGVARVNSFQDSMELSFTKRDSVQRLIINYINFIDLKGLYNGWIRFVQVAQVNSVKMYLITFSSARVGCPYNR